eukprot:c46329_g1_i1.p1 GENE.c46329_g1_i1~~c46329_g1_i1.p1  ORF type:complete len:201 (+),score=31.25 c46329_g1_i1:22-624(+)
MALGTVALLSVVALCVAQSPVQNQMYPMIMPVMFANQQLLTDPVVRATLHQHGLLHAGRPSAPGEAPAPGSQGEQVQAQTDASITSGLNSMAQLGVQAAQGAHNYLVPPYSWGWKLATLGASVKYPQAAALSDIPEYLNLVTGYFAGAPDATRYTERAVRGEIDSFKLPKDAPKTKQQVAKSAEASDPISQFAGPLISML